MYRFILITLLALSMQAQAQTKQAHQGNISRSGLAIEGYDPVAYFTSKKAVEGKKELAAKINGTVYYFSNAKNLALFKANPNRYQPQYGGWCAYAMGNSGEKVEVDPETFKIVDGKLYLFYNKFFTNTLTDWNKDEANLKNRADKNWQKFIN
ncbi:hypothetical protein CLV98_10922 [Dyadobacter jejuensis]|uniref:YHS domain-containing protein n=1 Tax=Dyadobacter jejuensis TaxID=1082580 RepID=A0A316AGS6_9BACT|nr:YHS domain-containing (seleno)protein [Dyadobacter jejuensis]PWJ56913.1 hypothetical protein CLV98_10922 [Dyadobacter jejuensis]